MFNLIYLVLGIYLIKIIVIRANIEYKKRKSTDRISLKKCIESKVKSIFADGNNIFVFRNNKNDYKEDSNINNKEEWNLKRHKALEKAKYKCEECGNITNLEVYTKEINNDVELICVTKRILVKLNYTINKS